MSGHLPWLYSAIKRCRKYVNFRQAKRRNPKYDYPSGKMAESKAWLSAWRNDGIQSMIIRQARILPAADGASQPFARCEMMRYRPKAAGTAPRNTGS